MKQYKLLFLLIPTLCFLLPSLVSAQVDTVWVRKYSGNRGSNDSRAIGLDNAGNVYITGESDASESLGTKDYVTVKYNSTGILQWVQRYNGPGDFEDLATALAVDQYNNVYVTGYSYTAETTNFDIVTIRYHTTGIQQWLARYDGPGTGSSDFDLGYAIAADNAGNVYVTGQSYGSNNDIVTIKYNSLGTQQWATTYNGPANSDDAGSAIAIDSSGNIYVTGTSNGSGTTPDYVTIKYNSAGVQQWATRYNGPADSYDNATAIAVDNSGNVYVTGYSKGSGTSYDYATIKYNAIGETLWVRRYSGLGNYDDFARALAVDASGNVYVTGSTMAANMDYTTIKYSTNGDTLWVRRYNGIANDADEASAIALDNSGNVYVTGNSTNSFLNTDCITIRYNPAGVQQWVARYAGQDSSDDYSSALAVDGTGYVYITGSSTNASGYQDYLTVKYVQTMPGIEEVRGKMQEVRELEIYPNPARTFFTVCSILNSQNSMLRIFDVSGKIVKEVRCEKQNTRISLDGIKNGVYFIQVDDKTKTNKLIVTK